MESSNPPERTLPVQYARSRAFRQFKNPPQPHMCILDTIKDTPEKLYINVLGWQKIANPKQFSDPIPLYGGMQVPQGCPPNSKRPPLLVFAVMVNPDILKANGKNAASPTDREALVSLLCDFVEAMNPGLYLARNPVILRDRDLAGELKDVWLAVQAKREREKGGSQTVDVMYKVYDIDGIGGDEEEQAYARSRQGEPARADTKPVKSSKQILLNAGQKSEFDSGMNNCQLGHAAKDNRCGAPATYCTPSCGQIVSSRENHNQIDEIQQQLDAKPFRRDWNPPPSDGWRDFSQRDMPAARDHTRKPRCFKTEKTKINGKHHYDFFPYFEKADADTSADDSVIVAPLQKLVLRPTDNKLCDSEASVGS